MFIKLARRKILKKIVVLIGMVAISSLVAADCAKDCEDEYAECLHDSKSTAKEKICGSILRECKMKCATDG